MRTLTRSLLLLSAATVTAAACAAPSHTAPQTAPTTTVSQTVPVVSVADGDTITVSLDGRRTTVRLIGIDTPETKRPNTAVQCFGPQASARTHALVDGARVQLETDPSGDRVDRYGRTLAYVWLTDGTMLNYQLVADGFAREYTYAHRDYRHATQFRAAADTARTERRGLWNACP